MIKDYIIYISSSDLSNRSANTIHVINMCEAISELGKYPILFANISTNSRTNISKYIKKKYGINVKRWEIILNKYTFSRGLELIISLNVLCKYAGNKKYRLSKAISRNLYATYFINLFFNKGIIYETHFPETGFRKILQNYVLKYKKNTIIVISNELKKIIIRHHNLKNRKNIYVFHDAAQRNNLISKKQINEIRKEIIIKNKIEIKSKSIVGYFGHLYAGRGIRLIYQVAKKNPKTIFCLFGGNEKDISECKKIYNLPNLYFCGYYNYSKINKIMQSMDILMMPYEEKVSVNNSSLDTSGWMSPIKLFEYMSSGVPIISSNHQVLKEILIHQKNSFIVKTNNVSDWDLAINKVLKNKKFSNLISKNSLKLQSEKYTWKKRIEDIVNL